ncbi:MAG: SprT family zinc-dependent metalloprotease [Chloroflexi bacterium]|nr:SprT family zinc-dependent metalloprotease [Chloroflexota bacterium]
MRLGWRTSAEPERAERSDHGVVQRDGLAISYRVVRSARRRKTLELSVEAEGVRVAAPLWASDAEVARFVHSKVPWILKHGRRPTHDAPRTPMYRDGESMSYLGRTFPLVVEDRALRRVQVTMDLLGVHIAVPRRLQEPARQAAIETAIRNWYRDRALEEVPYRVERWAAVLGDSPSRVLIRDQRRRWGSCAPDRTLRFNWRLAMLEPGLIDYVVVHELCHLRHPNHGAGFWAEVGRLMPDWRLRRAALVRAGRALPF